MNRIYLSAIAALLFCAACSTDDARVAPAPVASEDFTATISTDGRTVLDGTAVLWENEDKLTVFTKTAHNRQYGIKSLDATKRNATFTYEGYTGTDATKISANYALYPYDAAATLSGDKITTTLQAEQVYNATKVSLANALMVAKTTDRNFSFTNAGALLRFKVKMDATLPDEYTLQSIKLESAANALAGQVTIDLAADGAAVVDANGSKEVVLKDIDATINSTEQSFYVALPATQFAENDLTVTFTFAEGAKSVQLPAFDLNQNKIKNIIYEVKPDEFNGSTGEYGVADLSSISEPAALAAAIETALNDPEVNQIILPEETEVEISSLVFGAAASRSAATLSARDMTIDGNGSTLNYAGESGGRIIDVTKEAAGMNLTLKNLTIVNTTGYTQRGINYNTNGKLTLDNVTIQSNTGCAITYAVNCPGMSDGATVEINNSTITGNIALNLWGENTTANITDSTLSNYDPTDVENYATIVLNNDGTTCAKGSVINIKGGEIIALDQNGEACTAISNPALGTVTVDASTKVTGYIRNNVAIVDYGTDNHYGCLTLQDAITTAGKSNATVKLLSDVVLEEPVTVAADATLTLDLCGFSISQSSEEAVSMLTNKGSLTIADNKGEGKIAFAFTGTPGTSAAANAISNRGVMVINGGEISNTGSGNQIGYAIDNYNGASLTVNGGTISASGSSYYDGIRLFCGSQETVVTVNGGNISTIWAQNPSSNKASEVFGTVVINGGATGTIYYENYTTVKVKTGVTATVTPYGAGSDKTTTTEENGYTVYSFVQAYTISSIADLTGFASEIANGNNFAGETIKLTANIDLTGEFSPIAPGTRNGNKAIGTGFKGIFDGGMHTISGLTITEGAADDAIGLFGIVDGGEVKDIIFTDVNINAPIFAAGIVGNAFFNETPVGITSTEKVQVTNNLSTTAADNITANCTNLYVYDNSQGENLIASGNTQQ